MTRSVLRYVCWLLVGWLLPVHLAGQSFRLDTLLNVPSTAGLHNISGLEYIPSAGGWCLVGDKGERWQLTDLTHYDQAVREPDTGLRMESLRFDARSRTYFGAVEDDNGENKTYGFYCPDSLGANSGTTRTVFDALTPVPLPNKGIEGLALGQDSTLWVAPEAGWTPTDSAAATIQFYRYRWTGSSLTEKTTFAYAPDRMPKLISSDRYGGISEILWSGPNRLLVLERFYDSRRDTVLATLYEVAFQDNQRADAPVKTPVFNFNTQLLGHRVDNLEGMAWGPARPDGRRVLVIVSDDNGGRCPRPDGRKCQQTQLIFLSRTDP